MGACFLGCTVGGVSTAEEQKEEQSGSLNAHRMVCDITGDSYKM